MRPDVKSLSSARCHRRIAIDGLLDDLGHGGHARGAGVQRVPPCRDGDWIDPPGVIVGASVVRCTWRGHVYIGIVGTSCFQAQRGVEAPFDVIEIADIVRRERKPRPTSRPRGRDDVGVANDVDPGVRCPSSDLLERCRHVGSHLVYRKGQLVDPVGGVVRGAGPSRPGPTPRRGRCAVGGNAGKAQIIPTNANRDERRGWSERGQLSWYPRSLGSHQVLRSGSGTAHVTQCQPEGLCDKRRVIVRRAKASAWRTRRGFGPELGRDARARSEGISQCHIRGHGLGARMGSGRVGTGGGSRRIYARYDEGSANETDSMEFQTPVRPVQFGPFRICSSRATSVMAGRC